jgi:hypothetical protein
MMLGDSLPPLLRGIGTTVVLVAAILSVIAARADVQQRNAKRSGVRLPSQATVPP